MMMTKGMATTLWSDEHDLNADQLKLEEGQNLIYVSIGDEVNYHMKTVGHIENGLAVSKMICLDLLDEKMDFTTTLSSSSSSYGKRTLVIIQNLDHYLMNATKKTALDFLLRLTDSSTEYNNIILLLAVDSMPFISNLHKAAQRHLKSETITPDEPENDNIKLGEPGVQHWKVALAESIHEESLHINGMAFTGRLSKLVLDEHAIDRILFKTMNLNELNDTATLSPTPNLCSLYASEAHDSGTAKLDFTGFLALFSIPIILYYWYKWTRKSLQNNGIGNGNVSKPIIYIEKINEKKKLASKKPEEDYHGLSDQEKEALDHASSTVQFYCLLDNLHKSAETMDKLQTKHAVNTLSTLLQTVSVDPKPYKIPVPEIRFGGSSPIDDLSPPALGPRTRSTRSSNSKTATSSSKPTIKPAERRGGGK